MRVKIECYLRKCWLRYKRHQKHNLLHSPLKVLRPPIRVEVRRTFSALSSHRGCNRCAPESLWSFLRQVPCARDCRRWRLWLSCHSVLGRLLRQRFRNRLCQNEMKQNVVEIIDPNCLHWRGQTNNSKRRMFRLFIHFTWTSVCKSSWLRTGKQICWTHAQGLIRETVPARQGHPLSGILSGRPMHDRQDLSDSVFLQEHWNTVRLST